MKRLAAALQDPKTQALVLPPHTTRGGLRCFFSAHLLPPLVRLFADADVDFCREASVRLVLLFVTQVLPASEGATAADAAAAQAAAQAAAAVSVPALVARVGVQPSPEGAEEVRLLAVKLVAALLSAPGAVADLSSASNQSSSSSSIAISIEGKGEDDEGGSSEERVGGGVCAVLARSLGDLYPDVKRECCAAVRLLVATCPRLACRHGATLLAGLAAALGHQHAKTRQLALSALGQLAVCCAGAAAGVRGGAVGGSSSSGGSGSSGGSSSSGGGLGSDVAAAAEAAAGFSGMEVDERFFGEAMGGGAAGGAATRQAELRKCLVEVRSA
jgi:SWI/SNF-related matrix-associated actin-dependent regulator 1 of chromatin subfamily A